jgi:hypothetical protein
MSQVKSAKVKLSLVKLSASVTFRNCEQLVVYRRISPPFGNAQSRRSPSLVIHWIGVL